MSSPTDDSNDPNLRSWVDSSNDPKCDFPVQNLPFGIFRAGSHESFRGGVAIGDQILDLVSPDVQKHLNPAARAAAVAASAPSLNALMALGRPAQTALRLELSRILRHSFPEKASLRSALTPMATAEFDLPARVGDFADFYSSLHHARNVGAMFRPQNPILPNYWWLPVGYHGRTSSILLSGTDFVRPRGQTIAPGESAPLFGACKRLDYEAELGIFLGAGNALGSPIPIDTAEKHLFGMCLLNDWSARDIQTWEYQPLGPFLSKSFASSISPWVVTFDALEPYRTGHRRPADVPGPHPHLIARDDEHRGALDIEVEVHIETAAMRSQGIPPFRLSSSNYTDAFWSVAQLIAHYASGGCNVQAGDLLGSGTLSGPLPGSRACLLELTSGGKEKVALPNGESRGFLEDGDTVIMSAHCSREGKARIGFGECRATVLPPA